MKHFLFILGSNTNIVDSMDGVTIEHFVGHHNEVVEKARTTTNTTFGS
jgi:hypothetical protein